MSIAHRRPTTQGGTGTPTAQEGTFRTARAALLLAATSAATLGCASGFLPASEAVWVVVENRSERNVTVRALHHNDLVDFRVRVPRNERRSYRVSHRAFGDGPVTFEFATGPGRLGSSYRFEEPLRVPPGSTVAVVVGSEPRRSFAGLVPQSAATLEWGELSSTP